MNDYYVVGVIAIPYPRFGVMIIIISKEDMRTMSQLVTCRFAHAPSSQKCHLNCQEGKINGRIVNTLSMSLEFCRGWITIVTNSLTLQCTPVMRSCRYLNL